MKIQSLIFVALLFMMTSCSDRHETQSVDDNAPGSTAKNEEGVAIPTNLPNNNGGAVALPPAPGPAPLVSSPTPIGGGGGSQGGERDERTGNPDNDALGNCQALPNGPTEIICFTGLESPCNVGFVICRDGEGTCEPDTDRCNVALFAEPRLLVAADDPNSALEEGTHFVRTANVNSDVDSHTDLIAANPLSNSITVFFGANDGTFANSSNLFVGDAPSSFTTADFNGDAKLDIAVANRGSDNVTVWLGVGDGSFNQAAGSPFAAGDAPSAITFADVNGDGHADLLIANFDSDNFSVLAGAGDGTFAAPVHFAAGNEPVALSVGDLDEDGHLDVVVANRADNNVHVFGGDSTGVFVQVGILVAGVNPSDVAIGKLDGDDHFDIVVANYAENNVTFYKNKGGFDFTASNFHTGYGPRSIALVDLNNDKRMDIMTANEVASSISYLYNVGNSRFGENLDQPAGGRASSIAVGHFNDDVFFDAVVAIPEANDLAILMNTDIN